MKIEYNNLYTHFIFTTIHRLKLIEEKNRERIEKYILTQFERHKKVSFADEYDRFIHFYQKTLHALGGEGQK
jgi:hypothetical protein